MSLEWLSILKEKLIIFVSNLTNDLSYFPYSYTGDINQKYNEWGLANIVFAVRVLSVIGVLEDLDEKILENIYCKIIRFTTKKGYIIDPYITDVNKKFYFKFLFINKYLNEKKRVEDIHRAETRQTFAAIYLLKRKPNIPFKYIPYSEKAVDEYIYSFNWNTPWSAGSHLNHLLFFLWYNANVMNYQSERSIALIKHVLLWLNSIQSEEDGCWYIGNDISLVQKINGAMKIMNGFHSAQLFDIPYPKKLIDTALLGTNDTDACGNFNIIYVLFGAKQVETEYRKSEIEEYLQNRLDLYNDYYWPGYGGFSFFKGRANDIYYGKKITKGLAEPDIHGTAMFVWGLALIDKMLNLGLDFKIPLN